MSTSLVSLIGLPLSRLSSTANSRARSWMTRAIRYRYLARSRPGIVPQDWSKACRAAATARSTSASPACATLARGSSDAGLTVLKCSPLTGAVNSPPMNRPYSSWMETMSRDSGAGAYSQSVLVRRSPPASPAATGEPGLLTICRWPPHLAATLTYLAGAGAYPPGRRGGRRPVSGAGRPSVEREVVGAGVGAGQLLASLHEQVVEQAGRADPEVVRGQPLRPGGLPDEYQVADGVLGGAHAAGYLDADPAASGGREVPRRRQHDQGH